MEQHAGSESTLYLVLRTWYIVLGTWYIVILLLVSCLSILASESTWYIVLGTLYNEVLLLF